MVWAVKHNMLPRIPVHHLQLADELNCILGSFDFPCCLNGEWWVAKSVLKLRKFTITLLLLNSYCWNAFVNLLQSVKSFTGLVDVDDGRPLVVKDQVYDGLGRDQSAAEEIKRKLEGPFLIVEKEKAKNYEYFLGIFVSGLSLKKNLNWLCNTRTAPWANLVIKRLHLYGKVRSFLQIWTMGFKLLLILNLFFSFHSHHHQHQVRNKYL